MNTEQKSNQDNKSIYHCSHLLIGIFNIIVFICGTVLLTINQFFSGDNFSACITYIALIMLIVPTLYYLFLLIRNSKQK